MKKLNHDFLDAAKSMPPMYHTQPGNKFDIMESDVAFWLVNQPAIRQKVYDMAVNDKVIVYDPASGKWHGSAWEEE